MTPLPDSQSGSAGPGNGFTILLVDDDVSVRALVEATLEPQGYQLLKAFDSDQAMRLSDGYEGAIQVLITDQVMPPFMSGSELASCMRLMRPDIKVLYISGYEANDSVQDEVGDSSAEFLSKPFSPVLLLRKVAQLTQSGSRERRASILDDEDDLSA